MAAEKLVRASSLDWVILRLGGVLTVDPAAYMKLDNLYFESVLPVDGRLQTVDVRDVARAFAAATTADVVGETLLIGGDDSHRLVQGDIGPAMAAAMGLVGGLPTGLRGDPNDDGAWFNTDWMDTAPAQRVLHHQHHSWPEMLIETANKAGARRHLLRFGRAADQGDLHSPRRLPRPDRNVRRPVGRDRRKVGRSATRGQHGQLNRSQAHDRITPCP